MNSEMNALDLVGWTTWAGGIPGNVSKNHYTERYSDVTLCGRKIPTADAADVSGSGGIGMCRRCLAMSKKIPEIS
jgi:hypothetical protein